jgi:hypothetical protein
MLDFCREPLEPENAQMTMRLARARRARVTLRLAVQCGLAPSSKRLFLLAALFLSFLSVLLFPAIIGAIDRFVIAIVSVKSGVLIFVGKSNATPLTQATCTLPKPVRGWGLLPYPRGSHACGCGGGRASRRWLSCCPARATAQC